jgi:hypothetical protein
MWSNTPNFMEVPRSYREISAPEGARLGRIVEPGAIAAIFRAGSPTSLMG